ncbi:MAG: MBL fold metallo-hydrolase [Methanomassiliicoccus sp.]|nr:MBL fold metallo-hydrolase [Methanomassiliicoccus sp.]
MAVHMLAGAGYDCNVYIITGDRPIVVDAGTGERHARTLERIGKVVGDGPVQAIVLTHRHYDHVGGAAALSKALGAPVFAHEADAVPVREGSAKGTEALMFGQRMNGIEVQNLKGNEVFSTGDHELRVMHTPGHSAGGISLYDQEHGILISGDTVFAGGVGRWDLATGNLKELTASVRSLLALGPRDLYPGHGPCALGDATDQIRDAMRYLEE